MNTTTILATPPTQAEAAALLASRLAGRLVAAGGSTPTVGLLATATRMAQNLMFEAQGRPQRRLRDIADRAANMAAQFRQRRASTGHWLQGLGSLPDPDGAVALAEQLATLLGDMVAAGRGAAA